MSKYVALLGNTPQLSLAELQALVFSDVNLVGNHLAIFSLDNEQEVGKLQAKLGGVFKIMRMVKPLTPDSFELQKEIADYLLESLNNDNKSSSKIKFSLTFFGEIQIEIKPQIVKKMIVDEGFSSRYIETEQWGLSSIVINKQNNLFDLFIAMIDDELWLLETIAVSDAVEWIQRDRDKPYISGKKGMLPPKLARIMVNLGLGQLKQKSKEESLLLYDPFCGTGTVLLEALLRGCQVVGSDIDAEAVDGTRLNLQWLNNQQHHSFKYQLFEADVVSGPNHLQDQKVDLIVTEPFLGKPNPQDSELKNIYIGLEGLYLGAFKAWIKLLHKGSTVVIVFPYVESSFGRFDLQSLIDKLSRFGYTLVVNPIDYHREKAEVKRQILVFRYQ